jgi:hypothetical protein
MGHGRARPGHPDRKRISSMIGITGTRPVMTGKGEHRFAVESGNGSNPWQER